MKKVFMLEDLDCANCASKIENAVRELEGVISASVSFMTSKLTLETEEDRMDDVLLRVEQLIKKVDSDVTLIK